MSYKLRISLPSFDALTETDPRNFALFTGDEDHVLIKEFARGSVTIADGDTATINHNLGYAPFFLVYVNEDTLSANAWSLVGTGSVLSMLYLAEVDTTGLLIANNSGESKTFKYFIFYDNQEGDESTTFTESEYAFKVTKNDIDTANTSDPNKYLFHSDLNTFKIVHQDKATVTFSSATSDYVIPHNSTLSDTTSMMVFVKFPDGKTTLVAWYGSLSNSCMAHSVLLGLTGNAFDSVYFDETNIYARNAGVVISYDVEFSWLVFEAKV